MNVEIIDIVEIMKMIPHRYPFLLIDKVIALQPNHSIVGIKNVTVNEPQFTGHFPHRPIMPGVLIIEAMAQLSAVLVSKSMDTKEDKDVYFMSIESTKFRKIVEPGDTMYLYSTIEQNRSQVWKFAARAEINNTIAAESFFTAMVKNRL
ncbi:3-hydroxyacyl-ACP dehydratase FabZ [Candidatus Trichorickettsia mobilis]|uniref:3-hydroxyacyl-[acyl-carrier-protein] dehydratase FabZ n=1 Tax=Candidatus Trichorickettsia mobilis TaxID=1346319 RepID=A0ABZ0USN2_9RICK|nr:3-hydroxyacyl-ACP dehydratase FabZ [Candidatus Trichorickettsia mobilis]WPY01039.1 3-hydroxyacyl-ACP dehydratase FabZ [Candidatus Trichorickettsia mobilis]